MNLEQMGMTVFLGALLVIGIYLWSIPLYRKFRLLQLKRLRARKKT